MYPLIFSFWLAAIRLPRRPGDPKGTWGDALVTFLAVILIVVVGGSLCLFLWNVLMHFIGGWRRLMSLYRASQPIQGATWRAYGAVGIMPQNTLEFRATAEGLYVARVQFFDRFNKPLFIPWKDFHNARPGKSYTKEKMVTLDIANPPVGRLLLPESILAQSAGKALLADEPAPRPRSEGRV